ncbi:unnamed protein product, partial [Adineta steineri]
MKKNNYSYYPLKDEDLNTITTTTTSHNVTNNTLIWLDEEALNLNSHDTNLTIAMFESIADINYKLYNNLEIFLEEIGSMSKITKLIVITSGSFAKKMLPKLSLSLLREISSILIFCKDSTNCQYLLTECRKIMDICTDEQSLKESIENELHPSTDFLLMDRNLQPIFSLKNNNQDFNLYKQYIEILKHYPWSSNNREKMLDECIKRYRKDNAQRRKIEEFRNSYTSATAINWYTKDSFLYRLVNKALRSLDMEQINVFRPYIKDLCKQLEHLHKQNQSDTPLTVFRGHGNMRMDQFENIKENIGNLMSFNGFLSTTSDYNVALIFSGSEPTEDKSVIYEIRTNYNSNNVVFADITQFSQMEDEKEFLFSLCSIFRIDDIINDEENQLSKIIMSAVDEDAKFQDIKQCQQYIEQTSQKDRLAIIVSGRLGQEIVPHIHQLRQVISIYVYCMDKKNNEQWALKFSKVKSVAVDLDELVSQIKVDHKNQKKVEEPLPIYTFTTSVDAGKSTTGVNGQFVFFQILIDCLLRLKSNEIDRNELFNCCQNEYAGNFTELNNLHEFEEEYSPNKVLWWYTRETFFYKTLNAALRTQNIHMIFLFRSFIYDIYRQLQKSQSKHPLEVYRSQLMSIDELDGLKNNTGQFISINSMFSTSKQRTTALFLLGDITTKSDLERVLFEIDADPKLVTTKPFADISEHSYFPDESEVLFMIGSIFRLNNINRNDDQIWNIKMTLCNDDEHDLKQVLMYMKEQIESGEVNLRILGNILWEMGKFDLAEKYFTRSLKQLPSNDPLHISLYEDLGKLASQRGDYDMSMKWRQKLLTFREENPLATNVNVNKTNGSISKFNRQKLFVSKKPHQLTIHPNINKTDDSIRQLTLVNHININTKWKQLGITIAGGNGKGNQLNQLSYPYAIYVDDDHQTIYIADSGNHRIVKWKYGAQNGQVVAGGNGKG